MHYVAYNRQVSGFRKLRKFYLHDFRHNIVIRFRRRPPFPHIRFLTRYVLDYASGVKDPFVLVAWYEKCEAQRKVTL